MAAMSTNEAYVTRYGFPPKHWGVIAIAATFTLLAIFLPMGTFLRIATLVFFGGGGVLLLVAGLSRKVALRVDESGVTLGGSPLRYAATTAHVPWRDVEAVVLWRQELAAGMPYIGVLRPHGAPALPGIPTGTAGRAMMSATEKLAGAPDARLVTASRAITGWHLDDDRLATAMQRFAPGVPLIDQR
jgi:hypothetical protein